MMTFEEISKEYAIDENGIIKSPGKFEGEHWSSVELWDYAITGVCDQTEFLDDIERSIFFVDDEMRQKYGFDESIYAVVLFETDNGFVIGETMTESEYDMFIGDVVLDESAIDYDEDESEDYE